VNRLEGVLKEIIVRKGTNGASGVEKKVGEKAYGTY
jgi:hypothetical protein